MNNLDEVVSTIEKLDVTCKDNDGNWKTIEEILQEIAEKWDNALDNNKEE